MTVIYLLDMLGTAAFAASGALAGVRREMDLFGVLVLGMVTATGGGTLRDCLIGDIPPFIFRDETYLWVSLAVSLLVFFMHRRIERFTHPLPYFDAIGLGTFVVIGTGKGIEHGLGFFGAVMMGVLTATAGGMIRDVLSREIPMVLQREVYASACIAGGTLMYLLHPFGFSPSLTMVVAAVTVTGIRIVALHRGWSLPKAH